MYESAHSPWLFIFSSMIIHTLVENPSKIMPDKRNINISVEWQAFLRSVSVGLIFFCFALLKNYIFCSHITSSKSFLLVQLAICSWVSDYPYCVNLIYLYLSRYLFFWRKNYISIFFVTCSTIQYGRYWS